MSDRILLYAIAGILLWGTVALKPTLRKVPVSLPMLYVAAGWVIFELPFGLAPIRPYSDDVHLLAADVFTEFVVIVSLMGAGLAIDRPLSWRGWKQVWPLIAITMPLTIAFVALLGWAWGGLSAAAAVLLGAVLSPTDPVLARAVQVGPPGEGDRDDVRFNLTLEAGINDGLAFPFTYLAIALIGVTGLGTWAGEWFFVDVVWRIIAGTGVGIGIGLVSGWFVFQKCHGGAGERGDHDPPARGHEGLVVTALLFAAYGITELVEGYGFLAVFVGAVVKRQYRRASPYHDGTHKFIDELEDIVLVVMLIGLGGIIAGGVFDALTLPLAIISAGTVLVIRPIVGSISMLFSDLPLAGRAAVAFLGVRGIGTLYYLAYATRKDDFGSVEELWATATFAVLVSIVVHGVTARPIMKAIEARGFHVAQ